MAVTDDMRRLINVMVDWMVERSPASSDILRYEVVLSVLAERSDHTKRLAFTLSLALGIEEGRVLQYAQTSKGKESISEILSRCQRVFLG